MALKIHNVRFGRACNSSSSHSIIIVSDKETDIRDSGDEQFGWDYFTAKDKRAKSIYAGVSIYNALCRAFSSELANAVAGDLVDLKDFDFSDSYVDHQSMILMPKKSNGKLDYDFIKKYVEFLQRDDIVVLGGNDNDDISHQHSNKGESLGLFRKIAENDFISRYDKKYDYFTLFNGSDKIRLSFNKPEGFEPTKSQYPELVDLKITDYCDIGCNWCYQDSTKKGQHAPLDQIKKIVDVLSNMGVLEIALGGGETTEHPDFKEIIAYIKERNIIPNFTTQSTKWMNSPENIKFVYENVGAFAISIKDSAAAKMFTEKLDEVMPIDDYAPRRGVQLNAQYVMGTMNKETFLETTRILRDRKEVSRERIGYPFRVITLLGYKDVGRGDNFVPVKHNDWPSWIKEIQDDKIWPSLSWAIDTLLAEQSEKKLEDLDVPKWLYSTKEGQFSMYIDAVDMKCGPSSYCDKDDYKIIGTTNNLFKEIEDVYALF